MKTKRQPTILNFKKKQNTSCNNGPFFLECCKGRNGYRRKIKPFQKLRKVEVKQLRIITNGNLCRAVKRLCFVIINGKKIQFIQGTNSADLLVQQIIFPIIKEKTRFRAGAFALQLPVGIFGFSNQYCEGLSSDIHKINTSYLQEG